MNQEQIEQAARRYCQDMNYMLPLDTEPSLETLIAMDAFKAGANFALQNQWVSVEDGLPKDFETVFLRFVGKNDSVGYGTGYVVEKDWYTDIDRAEQGYFRYKITHWMSKPSLEGGEK